jgi:hypothetical protein
MFRSILHQPTYDHLFSLNGEGDGGGGSGGGSGGEGGTGEGGTGTPPAGGDEGTGEGSGNEGGKGNLTQAQFDQRMRERVNDTKRSTTEAIAKDLGVPLEEAKRLIAAAKATEDKDKSEAQLAREKADAEAANAATTKTEAEQERHAAKIERALLPHLNLMDDKGKALADDVVDVTIGRIARLVDVEVGADAEAIKAAVATLKKEMPLLFGSTEGEAGGGTPPPNGDPAGTPPKKTGAEGAFERGKKRAEATGGAKGYAVLESANNQQ